MKISHKKPILCRFARGFGIFLLFFAAFQNLPALAGGGGSVSAQFLKNNISARAAGMGGAFVAVADDIYSVYYNPAGVGQLYMPEISMMYHKGFSDIKTNFVAFGMPLPFIGLAGYGKSAFAISYLHEGDGTFEYRYINPATGAISTAKSEAESNSLLSLSYGEKIFSGTVNLEGYDADIMQFLGFSAKYLKSTLLEKYTASAFTFDAGYLITDMNLGLSFGASLSNGGGKLNYYSQDQALPLVVRAGFSHFRNILGGQALLLSVQTDIYTHESVNIIRAGIEYHFQDIFNFRLGYKSGENRSFTVGLGMEHRGFSLDLGMGAGGDIYNETQVALSYKFFGFRGYKKARKSPFREYREPRKPSEKVGPSRSRGRKKIPKKEEKSDFFWIY